MKIKYLGRKVHKYEYDVMVKFFKDNKLKDNGWPKKEHVFEYFELLRHNKKFK